MVLQSNLDRKAAAEYFVKIKKLGGEVELVASTVSNGEAANEPPPGQFKPRIIPDNPSHSGMNEEILSEKTGMVDRSWPVSSSRTGTQRPGNFTKTERQKKILEQAHRIVGYIG